MANQTLELAIARAFASVAGFPWDATRMALAGFGGCAVARVRTGDVDGWVRQEHEGYQKRTGHLPAIHARLASQGAHVA